MSWCASLSRHWEEHEDIDDVPKQLRNEIEHFFSVYKDLDPDRHSDVKEWGSRDSAMKTVEEARERFLVTAVSG